MAIPPDMCVFKNCDIYASFTKPLQIDVMCIDPRYIMKRENLCFKQCQELGCTKQPSFGLVGTKEIKWCKEHSPIGCTSTRNKTCRSPDCLKQPKFGLLTEKVKLMCSSHKLDLHVNLSLLKCKSCSSKRATKKNNGYCAKCK